jgi:phosphoglycolate phosphatase
MGLQPVSYEKVKATVGGGIRVTFSRLVAPEHVNEGVRLWGEKFEEIWSEGIEVLPGVAELLPRLQNAGYELGIYTNKEGPVARDIAEFLGWTSYFTVIRGRLDTPWVKPAAELTAEVLQTAKADVASTILIGDSPFDLETARNGGIRGYAVATGSHTEEQLREHAPASHVFPDMPALAKVLFPE